MNAVTMRAFRGQHLEFTGENDAWGKPTFLGAGFVLRSCGGAVLLGRTPEGPPDAAVKMALIAGFTVREPQPAYSFEGRHVEVLGEADSEGRPTFLGAGYVLGTHRGQLLLRKGQDGPADTAILTEHIRRIEVKMPEPQLSSLPKSKVLELQPQPQPQQPQQPQPDNASP